MENENIVTLQFKFTRRTAFLTLALLFLCWHPKPLGSETLQLTTYYPAPYGGYVSLLTTGRTLLAREGGANGRVGIRNDNPTGVLDIKMDKSNNNRFVVNDDNNVGIELRSGSTGGTPYIDFANDNTTDFDARLVLAGNGLLRVDGASLGIGINPATTLHVAGSGRIDGNLAINGGWLTGLCAEVPFGGGTSWCPGGRRVMAQYGTGSCYVGMVFQSGALNAKTQWTPHYEQGCTGTMLCCYVANW